MKLSTGFVVTAIPDMSGLTDEQKARWEKWIAALRSGTYTQAAGFLNCDKGFCCLGVACDLAASEDVGQWVHFGSVGGAVFQETVAPNVGADSYLPPTVQALYGLPADDGFVVTGYHDDCSYENYRAEYLKLAELNDSGTATFADIADILETAMKGGLAASST